jgi:DHA1 family multidrug/chloramphenicol efflux transport protein-like MFS transporter
MPTSPKTTERLNFKSVLRSYSHLLFHADFMLAVSAFSSLFAGLVGWITMSPYLLMENLKLSPITFGWLQIPIFGSNMLGAMLVKPLLEKIEKEKMIFYGTLISFLSGLILITFSIIFPNQIISFILPMSLYAFGFGLSSSSLSRMVYITTNQKHGIVASAFNLMMVGFAALISTLVSLFNETAVTASIVIAMTSIFAFVFNQIRQKKQTQR